MRAMLGILGLALASACGGGDDGSGDPDAPTAPADATAPTQDAPPAEATYRGICPPGATTPAFFSARGPNNEFFLYWTEGTPETTFLAFDLEQLPRALTRWGSYAYFTTRNDVGMANLWKAGGPSEPPVSLGDFVSALGAGPEHFVDLNERLLFDVSDGSPPMSDLWVTDGSPAGTRELGVTLGGPLFGHFLLDGVAYFVGAAPVYTNERPLAIWRSDGTAAGTEVVTTASRVDSFAVLPGRFLYSQLAWDESLQQFHEIWRSDGTPGSAERVIAIPSGFTEGRVTQPHRAGDLAVFASRSAAGEWSVWVTDGSEAGTMPIASATPRDQSTNGVPVVGHDVGAFFVSGERLWHTDGTVDGTRLVHPDVGLGAEIVATTDGRAFFNGWLGGDSGLWTSDGTPEGTVFLTPYWLAGGEIVPAGPRVLFVGQDLVGDREPWVSDGTAAGTVRLADVNPGPMPSEPTGFTPLVCSF